MEKNKKNIFIGIIIGELSVILYNAVAYWIIMRFMQITESYTYIIPLNLMLQTPNNILSEIPAIVIPSQIAIITIFFTIIALSFNLNKKLPESIIDKYIRYDKFLWTYLTMQTTFVIFSLMVLFLNSYDLCWGIVFVSNMILSIIITFFFFKWFLERTNKTGIYSEIIRKFSKKIKKDIRNNDDSFKLDSYTIHKFGSMWSIEKEYPAFDAKTNDENQASTNYKPYQNIFGSHNESSSKNGVIDYDIFALKRLLLSTNIIKKLDIVIKKEFVPKRDILWTIYLWDEYKENTKEKEEIITKLNNIVKLNVEESREVQDILECIIHSEINEKEQLDTDFETLERLLDMSLKNKRFIEYKLAINTLEEYSEKNQTSDILIRSTISLIYSIDKYIFDDPDLIKTTQNFLNRLLGYHYEHIIYYSKTYATSGLYLRDFIRGEFRDKFEKETNISNIDKYGQVILNTVNVCQGIINNTITFFFKNPQSNERYLKNQLHDMISILEFYHSDTDHYDRYYFKLDEADKRKKIIDKKCEIIRNASGYLKINITDTAFHMIYLVENNKLPHSLNGLIFNLMRYGDIYGYTDPSPFWNRSEKLYPSGGFSAPNFPKERYILTYLFYLKLNKIQDPPLEWKFDKLNTAQELKNATKDLKYEEINFWIKLTKNKFRKIKIELIHKFDEAIRLCRKDKLKVIINAKPDDDLISTFKNSVHKYWKENAIVRKLFEISENYENKQTRKPKLYPDNYFGFYFLFEKSYFIKDPPVPWARTLESDYGISLAKNENEKIVKNIISTKELPILKDNLEISLNTIINKFKTKKDLVIFIDPKLENDFSSLKNIIPNDRLNKTIKPPEDHYLCINFYRYNGIELPIYSLNNINALLVLDIKNIGKLVQYNAFKDTKEGIYIDVAELEEKDIDKIPKLSKGELKTKLKIRIAEKFNVEDIKTEAFEGYKLVN